VTATWANIASPAANDWLGLYSTPGAADSAYLSWRYTNGLASSNVPFTLPAGVAAGATYELRLFNSGQRRATSNSFTIQAITLSVSPTTVFPGGSITATWANIASPTANDWLGLYSWAGAVDNAYLSWRYTNGLASSNVSFTIPGGASAGATYELRLFNNGVRRATSNSFTIQVTTLSVSPTSVFPGAAVPATWANIASPTANDWLGLYSSPGAADNTYLSWRYTNGLASSNVPFTIPAGAAAGATYELRLFSNGVRRATSNKFTIQVTTLSVSPTTVFPGESVTATWANVAGATANDWLGLYSSSGAANNAYLSWRYTDGLVSSNLAFTIPAGAAAGATYELRLFSNGGRRATSNSFTIQAPMSPKTGPITGQ
jgi:hypothetical protein